MKEDQQKRVLCIEDNSDECELIQTILAGYDVTCVESIAAARPLLRRIRYVLVIIDEHLPDGSGLELCSQLTRREPGTPVIMTSGDPYITQAEAQEAGARALLGKSSQTYVEDIYRFASQCALRAAAQS